MSNPVETLFKQAVIQAAKNMSRKSYSSDSGASVKGIAINRDPPISSGWCGNDECEHASHKAKRAAQKAADTKAKK